MSHWNEGERNEGERNEGELSLVRQPDSLDELPGEALADPWGRPSQYLRIAGNNTPGLRGRLRKDRNLVPINSDYDLYSFGEDGDSRPPLTARPSRDDRVRAADGSFVGQGIRRRTDWVLCLWIL